MPPIGHNAKLIYQVPMKPGHPPIWEMQDWVHLTWEAKPDKPPERLSFCFTLGETITFHCSDRGMASAVRIMWG
jgi:hypothetical protein